MEVFAVAVGLMGLHEAMMLDVRLNKHVDMRREIRWDCLFVFYGLHVSVSVHVNCLNHSAIFWSVDRYVFV